jgi:hypothetical protein
MNREPHAGRTPRQHRPAGRDEERDLFRVELLAKLPAADDDPVTTRQIGDALHLDAYHRDAPLRHDLHRLVDQGLVARLARPDQPPGTPLRWRRTDAGDQAVRDAAAQRARPTGTDAGSGPRPGEAAP